MSSEWRSERSVPSTSACSAVSRAATRPETSDVDLLVALETDAGLFALLRMQSAAEAILGRSVDVVPSSGFETRRRRTDTPRSRAAVSQNLVGR